MERNKRLETTQPEDWIKAFRVAADKKKMSLSEWLGMAGISMLPPSVRKKLSKRRKRGRSSEKS